MKRASLYVWYWPPESANGASANLGQIPNKCEPMLNIEPIIDLLILCLFVHSNAKDRKPRHLRSMPSSQRRAPGMDDGRIVNARPSSVAVSLWSERLQLPQLRRTCVGKDRPLRILRRLQLAGKIRVCSVMDFWDIIARLITLSSLLGLGMPFNSVV